MRLIKLKPTFILLPAIIILAIFVFGAPVRAADIAASTDDSALKKSDSDKDGLKDWDEIHVYHTDPNSPDTDNDGYKDKKEIYYGYSPRHSEPVKLSRLDSDRDGVPDSWEIRLKMDLLNPDVNGNGRLDGEDINRGFDPRSKEPKKIDKSIQVTLKDQKLAYYIGSTKLEEFKISSGVKSMPTPTGDFTVLDKVPAKNYGGRGYNFSYPDTKWNLHFTTAYYRYYIHGAYWHDKFGQPMSHGCINVSYKNMERLYDFAQVGTKIKII
jgi:hypothetical protein